MPRTDRSAVVAGLALFGLASLASLTAVSSRPARAQDEDPDALLRADRAAALKRVAAQLFAEGRYRDALAQYQAAYAVRQEAALLLLIARSRHPQTRVVAYEPQAQLVPLGNSGSGGLAVGVGF